MEKNKSTKILGILLAVAVIVIGVMSFFIYRLSTEKAEEKEKVANSNNQVANLEGTVGELQGKIDAIANIINSNNTSSNTTSNTTKKTTISDNLDEIKYDFEIPMSELEQVNYSDNELLKSIEDKYKGKIVKITGYVNDFGKSDLDSRKNICKYR